MAHFPNASAFSDDLRRTCLSSPERHTRHSSLAQLELPAAPRHHVTEAVFVRQVLKSLDGTGKLSDIERRDKDMRTGAAGGETGEERSNKLISLIVR